MTARATCWSVTINNPIPADEENISLARQRGWTVDGQLEKGESGTPHYQLLVKTPQVRFSAIKKQFPRAHIEVARNPTALSNYVHKEDTKVAELSSDSKFYPSLQKLWDMFADYVIDKSNGAYHDWTEKRWLREFDLCIGQLIQQGYVVETMAVNPQIRCCVSKFGDSIIFRSIRRQSDRQTDNNSVSDIDITHAAPPPSPCSSSSRLSGYGGEEAFSD